MKFSLGKIICLLLLMCIAISTASPTMLFNLFRGNQDDRNRDIDRNRDFNRNRDFDRDRYRSGGRSYQDIAKVINPNPYVVVYKDKHQPYPNQPFWPYG